MFAKKIGIDLGTANSLVYLVGKGIVLQEPTVVAITAEDNKVVAIGSQAREMLGRTPANIITSRPMRDGVIADYIVTEAMLRYFLDKICGRSRFFKPDVMICAPAGVTSVERRAVLDATLSAGAKNVYLIDEPLAASIGANMPIGEASGNMVVNIGGGTTEVAVIALGGIVVHNTLRVAGNKIDEALASYIRKKYSLVVGDQMAEEIKIKIGSALPLEKEMKIEIKGRDIAGGLPRTVEISSTQATEAIKPVLSAIILAIKKVFEDTPPELAADIIDKGIMMTGGTSLLRNFDQLLTQALGVPCYVADNPIECVVQGTGIAIENLEDYKRNVTQR
ncbi:rod shape-determining protein [candidate division WWE3 bacterium CG_4_8_14_3_um_filter_42_11]|uniref:Cell shape-determining protein MreB n=2 Tax=Katanobacteria TaxID=422282 RepID=A0A2M8G890_UNCKA|nr:MAG: rod shape-determining protein [candidate division WWE3 bacterium CG_4_8_14_3_um_filter_42_11]